MVVKWWVESTKALYKVAAKCPHLVYAGFAQSLQPEWQYLSRCVPGVGIHLKPVELAVRQDFIPALLVVEYDQVEEDIWQLLANCQWCKAVRPEHSESISGCCEAASKFFQGE